MTATLPEPTNVGPIAGGNLRASDADRERVAAVLNTAYADGRITRDEHEERLDQLLGAKTFDELIPITHDLVAVRPLTTTTTPVAQPVPGAYTIEPGGSDSEDTWIGIFGGVTRKGKWHVKRTNRAFALFGGMDLDICDAIFEGDVIEISGFWCFGGMDIKVPPGIQIRDQTVGIFGGSDVSNLGEPQPGAPTIVIKGMCLFGGVSVHGPKPPRQDRHRNRHYR